MPAPSSITFQGIFNQHLFYAGPPEEKAACALAVQAAYAPEQLNFEDTDGKNDVYVGCFLKSCHDGRPRDGTPIDMVIVLDVSGSMGGGLGGSSQRSRLELAKEALEGLLAKLQSGDRFGLATFTNVGTVIQPLQFVEDLDHDAVSASIHQLHAGGGTTLEAGMDAAVGICKDAPKDEGPRHRRLLFLTDMNDMGSSQLDEMIAAQAKEDLYVSFVGIGMDFNSELADKVTQHRGANYFCITRDEELKKVVADDFDWNFFPAAFEVEIAQQSDAFDLVGVYGTPFDTHEEEVEPNWQPKDHQFYPPQFKEHAKELLLCSLRCSPQGGLPSPALQQTLNFLSPDVRTVVRVDTVFPSALANDGSVEGGLILLRLRPRTANTVGGNVRLMLRYVVDGEEQSKCEDLQIPARSSVDLQVLPQDSAVVKGIALQRFVDVCKSYLSKAQVYDEKPAKLQAALHRIDSLLRALEQTPSASDSLCPGVREELADFARMARKHCERLNDHKNGSESL